MRWPAKLTLGAEGRIAAVMNARARTPEHGEGDLAEDERDVGLVLASEDGNIDGGLRTMNKVLNEKSVGEVADATVADSAQAPSEAPVLARTGVLRLLGHALGVRVLALPNAGVVSTMKLDPREPVDPLARIERERGLAVARAGAVVWARRFIDRAWARLGTERDPGLYDVEEGAWDLVLEDRDEESLAQERREALEELRHGRDGEERVPPSCFPSVIAMRAQYHLAAKLRGVLLWLQKTDERDLDELVADLRDRLSRETETPSRKGMRRALRRLTRRYQVAMALRVLVDAFERLVKTHVSTWPPGEREAEEKALRAIVFGEES